MRDLVDELLHAKVKAQLFGGDHAPRLGRLIILERIGAGAMGDVFSAHDPRLDRKVAVKLVRPTAAVPAERVLAEARALAKLAHPNVVAIYDAEYVDSFDSPRPRGVPARERDDIDKRDRAANNSDRDDRDRDDRDRAAKNSDRDDRDRAAKNSDDRDKRDVREHDRRDRDGRDRVAKNSDRDRDSNGAIAIVMELASGISLRTWLATDRDWNDIARVMHEAAAGLAAAHASGLVHRDIKPDNILVGDDRTRVVDFGLALANASSSSDNEAASGAGTPTYMAPEVLGGAPATPAADQFSFGVTLFEALYGVRPHAGTSREELRVAAMSASKAKPTRSQPTPRDAVDTRAEPKATPASFADTAAPDVAPAASSTAAPAASDTAASTASNAPRPAKLEFGTNANDAQTAFDAAVRAASDRSAPTASDSAALDAAPDTTATTATAAPNAPRAADTAASDTASTANTPTRVKLEFGTNASDSAAPTASNAPTPAKLEFGTNASDSAARDSAARSTSDTATRSASGTAAPIDSVVRAQLEFGTNASSTAERPASDTARSTSDSAARSTSDSAARDSAARSTSDTATRSASGTAAPIDSVVRAQLEFGTNASSTADPPASDTARTTSDSAARDSATRTASDSAARSTSDSAARSTSDSAARSTSDSAARSTSDSAARSTSDSAARSTSGTAAPIDSVVRAQLEFGTNASSTAERPASDTARTTSDSAARDSATRTASDSAARSTSDSAARTASDSAARTTSAPGSAATADTVEPTAFDVAVHSAADGTARSRDALAETMLSSSDSARSSSAPARTASRRTPPTWLHAIAVRALAGNPRDRFASMNDLAAALGRDRRRRRWIAASIAAVAIAAGASAFVAYRARGAAIDPCAGADVRVGSVWSRERASDVRAQLGDTGNAERPPREQASWVPLVIAALDERGATWTKSYRTVCEATRVRGAQSDTLLDLRMRCLDRALDRFDALSSQLANPLDPRTRVEAASAVAELPDARACETLVDPGELALPADFAGRQRAIAARHDIARAWAAFSLSKYGDARAIGERIERDIAGLDAAGVIAELAAMRAAVEARIGTAATAKPALDRALVAASRANAAELETKVWAMRLRQELFGGDPAHVKDLVPLARAAAARAHLDGGEIDGIAGEAARDAGDLENARLLLQRAWASKDPLRPDQRAVIAMNLGAVHLASGDLAKAEGALGRALELAERTLGAGHPSLALYFDKLAALDRMRGQLRRALSRNNASLEMRTIAYGEDDRAVATSLLGRARTYLELGDVAAAKIDALRARAIRTAVFGEDSARLGEVEAVLGDIDAAAGDLDAAQVHYRRTGELDRRVSLVARTWAVAGGEEVLGLSLANHLPPNNSASIIRAAAILEGEATELRLLFVEDGFESLLRAFETLPKPTDPAVPIALALVALRQHDPHARELLDTTFAALSDEPTRTRLRIALLRAKLDPKDRALAERARELREAMPQLAPTTAELPGPDAD